MIEVGPNLFHASGPRPDAIRAELVAIARVRDEMWRLPFFLAYHRWLGVQHFVVIDNRSKDGTPDFLGHQQDVTCLLAPGDFGADSAKWGWIEWALRLAPPERWNLLLDADELFVGPALRRNNLRALTRELDNEGAAIAAASLVDCYPAVFPFAGAPFQPVPWERAPYFDTGPYFQWPESDPTIRYLHRGVRERLFWPHWGWARRVRKVVPRPLRPRQFQDSPPLVLKMPLLRNVRPLTFNDVHSSSGAPRSRSLFSLLHYKLDVDLSKKVNLALCERQYARGSRDYEAYARVFAKSPIDLRYRGTRRFEGARSLLDAGLTYVDAPKVRAQVGRVSTLHAIVSEIWSHGDYALQRQVWDSAWGTGPGDGQGAPEASRLVM